MYNAIIRLIIAFGAPVWHKLGKKLKGLAAELEIEQTECLRIIYRAYKATPIRQLETELATPLLDLYLSKRVADF